jgi:S1-C subfamily serine protease
MIFIENMGEDIELVVDRNGVKKEMLISKNELSDLAERTFGVYSVYWSPEIMQVVQDKPAKRIGLEPGDIITEANGEKIYHSQQFVDLIKNNSGKELNLKWQRNSTDERDINAYR